MEPVGFLEKDPARGKPFLRPLFCATLDDYFLVGSIILWLQQLFCGAIIFCDYFAYPSQGMCDLR
jgi:hypothetical protein